MHESLDRAAAGARRSAAELRLANALHGLVSHELGNPLQSLVVLVELTRDEIEARAPDDPGVQRLARALESVERFREVLVRSGEARRALFGLSAEELDRRRWGATLDTLLRVVAHRLARADFHRDTGAIDELLVGAELPASALLAMFIGVSERLRAARGQTPRVELDGRVIEDRVRLCLSARGPEGELLIVPGLADWLDDLLAEAPGCTTQLDAGGVALWVARV